MSAATPKEFLPGRPLALLLTSSLYLPILHCPSTLPFAARQFQSEDMQTETYKSTLESSRTFALKTGGRMWRKTFLVSGSFYSADLELTGKTPRVLCKPFFKEHFLSRQSRARVTKKSNSLRCLFVILFKSLTPCS